MVDLLCLVIPDDEDPVRRDAVRRKAAKCLIKAEKLYAEHINQSDVDETENFVCSNYADSEGIV